MAHYKIIAMPILSQLMVSKPVQILSDFDNLSTYLETDSEQTVQDKESTINSNFTNFELSSLNLVNRATSIVCHFDQVS